MSMIIGIISMVMMVAVMTSIGMIVVTVMMRIIDTI